MWKNELRKAERLPGTPDVLLELGMVLEELGRLPTTSDIFRFFEKPYNWQDEYKILLEIAEKYDLRLASGKVSLTEILENEEASQEAVTRMR